jgi:hypothetical protein
LTMLKTDMSANFVMVTSRVDGYFWHLGRLIRVWDRCQSRQHYRQTIMLSNTILVSLHIGLAWIDQ